MNVPRRQLLQALSFAFGSSIIPSGSQFGIAVQDAAKEASPATHAQATAQHQQGETKMEKVAGIGGFFFRARDPKALAHWYEAHLGIAITPTTEGGTVWQQEAGPTSFTPFPETSKYFGDPNKAWMVNFRVRDLAKMVAQLRAAGIEVNDPQSFSGVGSFTRLHDPEGNPIELWQPS